MTPQEYFQPSRLIYMSNNGGATFETTTLPPNYGRGNFSHSLHKDDIEKKGVDIEGVKKPTCKNFCSATNLCSHGVCAPHSYSFSECSNKCRNK